MPSWIYWQSEPELYTVGVKDHFGGIITTDSDYDNKSQAGERCARLNGGGSTREEQLLMILEQRDKQIKRLKEEYEQAVSGMNEHSDRQLQKIQEYVAIINAIYEAIPQSPPDDDWESYEWWNSVLHY